MLTLALLGKSALLGLSRGLAVVDVSNPELPEVTGRLNPPNGWDTSGVTAAAHGYFVYRENASPRSKWVIGTVAVADGTAPQLVGTTELSWVATSLVSSANFLFAGTPAGLQKFAYKRSTDLNQIESLPLPAAVESIVHADRHAYVADGDGGLFIVYTGDSDLSETVAPPQPPTLPTPTSPTAPPSPTAIGLAPTPGPEAHICPQILTRVPGQVLSAALANPDSVQGWNRLQNPGVPPGPFNLRRRWLSILTLNVPFNLLFNPVIYKASCP